MSIEKKTFRPSNISRYINCNLWKHLPFEEKTPEQLVVLQRGTDEHSRLEDERFKDSEKECEEYFKKIKDRCVYFFKEQHIEMEIEGRFLEGTPDVYGYDEEAKTLHVIDYKTGRRYVTAENNDQLLAYAMLVLNRHNDWKIENIELAILNTHHDAVNRHFYMGKTYIEKLKERVKEAVVKNDNDESFGKPGNWCQFCPSKKYCIRKRGFFELKKYADMDTDDLIFETKQRSKELTDREREVKLGVFSSKLSPLLKEKSRKFWKDIKNLPDQFFAKKPMTISEAERLFSKEEFSLLVGIKKIWGFYP